MSRKKAVVCFFVGTEAELIKIFPVILNLNKQNTEYRIISSGQNDISQSKVLAIVNGGKIDVLLSDHSKIKKTAFGLLCWYIHTSKRALRIVRDAMSDVDLPRSILVIHGDTISTVMGAMLGAKLGMKVAHIEAGLRSHDFFNPFPEEIDRVIASRYASIHFAPGKEAMDNLKNVKGEIVNTIYNTILDSLKYSNSVLERSKGFVHNNHDYFVFVLHRQENLSSRKFVQTIVDKVIHLSKHTQCIMIMHKPTEVLFQEAGLLEKLGHVPSITITPRMEYFEFMRLLSSAEFVITDGGSNQEELTYLGKPCLLIRKKTERNDGLGRNVVLCGGDLGKIDEFARCYKSYEYPKVLSDISPSKIISEKLVGYLNEK